MESIEAALMRGMKLCRERTLANFGVKGENSKGEEEGEYASVANTVVTKVDVENQESAARLLQQLSEQTFLKQGTLMPGVQTRMDAYRMPDYKGHAMYVFSGQIYAVTIRLHAALVGD